MTDSDPGARNAATEAAAGEPTRRFRDFPLFQGLDEGQIAAFLAKGEWFDLAAGEILIEQAEEGGKLFFVSDGELEVFGRDEKGGEHPLAVIEAPAVVGELEFLTGEPRAASVRARTPVRGFALSSQRLLERLEAGDPVSSKVFFRTARVLARRLAAMNRKFIELDQRAPGARFDELRDFQTRLMTEWTM
jgi:CRP-like cAMP-binding protein